VFTAFVTLVSCSGAGSGDLPPVVGPNPNPQPEEVMDPKVFLGQSLFFDKILSGENNISCSTCHGVDHGLGDASSLSLGAGAHGSGPSRQVTLQTQGVTGRNTPHLYNIGELQNISPLFHDGRVQRLGNGQITTPVGNNLPFGLDDLVAVQALFPLVSQVEMSGEPSASLVGTLVANGDLNGAWNAIAQKIRSIPQYASLFMQAYPTEIFSSSDIQIRHVANALSSFQKTAFVSKGAPIDRFLQGQNDAINQQQADGWELFSGAANCTSCHAGTLFTDGQFHVVALPQLGPIANSNSGDVGREFVTGSSQDRYRFRTPSLKNVKQTGPWGHNGSVKNLSTMIIAHFDPARAMFMIQQEGISGSSQQHNSLMQDFKIFDTQANNFVLSHHQSAVPQLNDFEVELLVDFLGTMTDSRLNKIKDWKPVNVPSGLSID